MKRAYFKLKKYYAENKVDIIFKMNGTLLVIIVVALCSYLFSSVPVTDITVDECFVEATKLEQVSQSDSEEENCKYTTEQNMLCHNIHFDNNVDVDRSKAYLYKNVSKSLMIVDREFIIYSSNNSNLPSFVYLGNSNYYYGIVSFWTKFNTENIVADMNEVIFKLLFSNKRPLIYRKARAPNVYVGNALIIDT
jgi:hypothetical protein